MRKLSLVLVSVFVFGAVNNLFATRYYVDAARPDDAGDGLSMATAKKSIQGAVDLTADGDMVIVAAGTYDSGGAVTPGYTSLNRVVITNNITVVAVDGAAKTTIVGRQTFGGGVGINAMRCVYISSGVLDGFTLTDGYTMDSGNTWMDQCGGGIRATSDGIAIRDCVIKDCAAYYRGGGVYSGDLYDCTIMNNRANSGGGGTAYGDLHRCEVFGNTGGFSGGGCYDCDIDNSLLVNNNVGGGGGGAFRSTLISCTVCGNVANHGGGLDSCTVAQSIVYYNSAVTKNDLYVSDVTYTCSPDTTNGVDGCITSAPIFTDLANNNYRLQVSSPCIDKGQFKLYQAQTDLDGKVRVSIGPDASGWGGFVLLRIDLGAYEWLTTVANDYDGDRSSDLCVLDQATGRWFARALDGTQLAFDINWGWPGVEGVSGDYDGDGKADLAIFDQGTGRWFIRKLSGAQIVWENFWGWPGVRPVAGDYNGDGKSDLAIFDQGSGRWFIKKTNNEVLAQGINWGWGGVVAVPGDYDGDGKDDLAVFDRNTGRWFIRKMDGTTIAFDINWGWPGVDPVAGDYNGDGKSDLAIFDQATGRWFIRSVDGVPYSPAAGLNWGWPGVRPVSGDFDGDGADDLAIFDEATGRWFVRSLEGEQIAWDVNWGWGGVQPIGK